MMTTTMTPSQQRHRGFYRSLYSLTYHMPLGTVGRSYPLIDLDVVTLPDVQEEIIEHSWSPECTGRIIMIEKFSPLKAKKRHEASHGGGGSYKERF